MKRLVIGIDVGGTNVKLGLVSAQGKVISKAVLSTKDFRRRKAELVDAIVTLIRVTLKNNNLKKTDIAGIGIGLPGLIDPVRGMVHFLPNIPGWKNVPLRRIFERQLGIPTFLENDVNLIALGEWKFGAGRGARNMVCITLGTGVGGGLIFNNQLYRGEGFVAGEVGHIPLNEEGPACGCGGYGCFERYVGNRYVLKEAEKIFGIKGIDFPDIRRLTRQNPKKAMPFWETMATHIGNGLVGIINLLNPTLIVIGGGVSNNHRFLFPTIRKVIKRRALPVSGSMAKLVRAQLGDEAGIIGANVLVYHAV